MKLSKLVPARTVTVEAEWVSKDWLTMTQQFRAIRAKTRRQMNKCFWCRHPFADGEMMSLAGFIGRGNNVLCQKCADELLASNAAGLIEHSGKDM